MSTGEILDRTFGMYRKNFWLFVGISALPPALMLIVNLLITGTTFANRTTAGIKSGPSVTALLIASIGAIVGVAAYLFGLAIAHGATVFAVSAVHLGRTISIAESYRRMKGRYGRVIGLLIVIGLMVVGTMIVVILVFSFVGGIFALAFGRGSAPWVIGLVAILVGLGAGILIIWFYLRFSLSVAACVLENLRIGASLKRSMHLARGSLGKIFVIYLLMIALNLGVSVVLLIPIQVLQGIFKNAAAMMTLAIVEHFATFIVGALIGPLATIALALVYYDERVRKEAFDIQLMMESLDGATPALDTSGAGAPIG